VSGQIANRAQVTGVPKTLERDRREVMTYLFKILMRVSYTGTTSVATGTRRMVETWTGFNGQKGGLQGRHENSLKIR
jgi:hypothetical protein